MNLPSNLFSTAFRQQRLGLMLSLLIGIMVYLGSLAMAAQAVLARSSMEWGHSLQNRMTIELLARPGEKNGSLAKRAENLQAFLEKKPEIVSVKLLPETETTRLLKPWIDDESLLEALALPRLLDIEIALSQPLNASELVGSLKPIVGEVRIHRHQQGMTELMGFVKGLGALALLMLLLTGLALVVIIALICRAAMAVQHETIELLHYMGATDSIVAQHFRDHVRALALPASVLGFVFAILTVVGLAFLLGSLGGLSLVSAVSWVTVVCVMALVPLAAIGLVVLTARLSVRRLLRRWV